MSQQVFDEYKAYNNSLIFNNQTAPVGQQVNNTYGPGLRIDRVSGFNDDVIPHTFLLSVNGTDRFTAIATFQLDAGAGTVGSFPPDVLASLGAAYATGFVLGPGEYLNFQLLEDIDSSHYTGFTVAGGYVLTG